MENSKIILNIYRAVAIFNLNFVEDSKKSVEKQSTCNSEIITIIMIIIIVTHYQQQLSFVEGSYVPDTVIGILYITHFLLNTTLYNYPCVTDQEMKILQSEVSCSRSYSQLEQSSDLNHICWISKSVLFLLGWERQLCNEILSKTSQMWTNSER